MENKIIFPAIIIIFSVLIIFAILNKRKNDKLQNNIEKFISSSGKSTKAPKAPTNSSANSSDAPVQTIAKNKIDFMKDLKLNTMNNSIITEGFANGDWTTPWTYTDIYYRAYNLMSIDAKLMAMNYGKSSYGNIRIRESTDYYVDYNIIFILNENIVAVSKNNSNINLHMKIFNIYTNEGDVLTDKGTIQSFNTLTALVSIFAGNILSKKFYSYKTSGETLSQDLYNDINSNNNNVIQPAEVYDFNTYKTIIGNYKFPNNSVQVTFGVNNTNIYNTINSEYGGQISFAIQRTYNSPTSNQIMTKMSQKIAITCNLSNQIPNNILISSFQSDLTENSLTSSFIPAGTSVYFYKLISVDTTYDYSNSQLTTVPSSTFDLQNNATNMYQSNVQFNDLNTVEQINNSIYEVTLIGYYTVTNLTETVTIPFSVLYNLL